MTLDVSELGYRVIGCAIEVHRQLGPGLLESAYLRSLVPELTAQGIHYVTQVPVPLALAEGQITCAYRADLLVEGALLVEIKCVERFHPVHSRQVLTYLKLLGLRRGLLINFNVPILRHGIRQVLNPHKR